jgi:malonyl-CoA/methylmalonyl-CoA synthetase
VGPPLPGVEVRVVDPESGRRDWPEGEIGMIEMRGPNVFQGYWRMPEKTAAEFRPDGFFISGDLGLVDAKRLRPHRRARQGPGDLRRLQRLPEGGRGRDRRAATASIESAVIGLAHRDFGEGVTAVVVRRKPGATLERGRCAQGIWTGGWPSYKQPKRVLFVDDLPRNAMGKVQKNVLRETYKALYAG